MIPGESGWETDMPRAARSSTLIGILLVAACGGETAPLVVDLPEVTEIPLAGRLDGERDFLLSQSPDGDGFIFTRMDRERKTRILFVADPFSGDAPSQVKGSIPGDADAVFDPAGGRVLFMANGRQNDADTDQYDLFEADWRRGAFDRVRSLDGLNTVHDETFPGTDRSGTVVFASTRPGGAGGQDLYEATPGTGGWNVRFLEELNSFASDSNPLLFPDGRKLIFYSARPGGFGQVDLYVSRRGEDGSWGEPVNLGPGINTADGEYAPSLSADGKVLFFARGAAIYGVNIASVPALAE